MLDVLYRVAGADFNRPVYAYETASNSGAATSVAAAWQNVQQLPFMPANVAVVCGPGAAQYATKWFLRFTDAADILHAELAGGELLATLAASSTHIGYPVRDFIVPPRSKLTALVNFNAGAASNTTRIYVVGWYIPRGTLGFP